MTSSVVIPAPRALEMVERLRNNIECTIRRKTDVIDRVIICLLAGGHLLIEDLPGLGKTTLAYCLARSIDCTFSRIQFTSDILPDGRARWTLRLLAERAVELQISDKVSTMTVQRSLKKPMASSLKPVLENPARW